MNKFKKAGIFIVFVILFLSLPLIVSADSFPKMTLSFEITFKEDRDLEIELLKEGRTNDFENEQHPNISDELYNFLLDNEIDGYVSGKIYRGAPYGTYIEPSKNNDNSYLGKATYLYPKKAKLLIFDKTNNAIYVTEPFSQKAFDAVIKINLPTEYTNNTYSELTIVKTDIKVVEIGSPVKAISSGLLRALLTIIAELVILLLFLYKQKKSLLLVLVINLITQAFMTVGLGFVLFYRGPFSMGFSLIVFEILVFAFETALYIFYLKEHTKLRAFLYGLAANGVTLAISILLMAYS